MILATIAGPPSSGKTSVLLKMIPYIRGKNANVGVIKFDCLATFDDELYKKAGVEIKVGLSGNLCPDHYFVTNIEDCTEWGMSHGLDYLFSESAGLCNRCAPHIKDIPAICVIDCLSGVNTPKKIGPMLKMADIVVITKGDIVSQAEREVFLYKVRQANPRAITLFINGITGQGAYELFRHIENAQHVMTLKDKRLRFSIPAAVCSYCLGGTKIGEEYQRGTIKKMAL